MYFWVGHHAEAYICTPIETTLGIRQAGSSGLGYPLEKFFLKGTFFERYDNTVRASQGRMEEADMQTPSPWGGVCVFNADPGPVPDTDPDSGATGTFS
jgi:hypothetical protein